jgi:tetratricopeptide (TPR) repeat protein
VEALMHPPAPSEDLTALDEGRAAELSLEQALAALQGADAAHSPDVRLRFDLGIVYERLAEVRRDDVLQEKVVAVLAPALDESPDDPGAPEALSKLAVALAHLDRPREELATWRRYIPKLADDEMRLLPMMNMGEAEMRLGELDAALSTFHASLDICQSLPNSASMSETYALILWDVAIALDRQGDPIGALRTAAKARAFSWTMTVPGVGLLPGSMTGWDAIRDSVDVFFVPDWERDWYLALGEAAVAADASDPRLATKGWAEAERHWNTYLARATEQVRDADTKADRRSVTARWAAIAKLRRDHAHRAGLAAEKRAAALPAPASSGAIP